MYFLQPLGLLLLGAALIPPLLHLFQRRRPPDVAFPAVRYLRQTEREALRTIRLRHVLLLLLRVAAVALVALAAARPVVPRQGAGHQPTAVVLVLDHSLSSGAVAGGVRAFDDLAARARETLAAARASDGVWLIGADGIARRGSREELLRVLASARPEARRLDLTAAIATAARLVRASGYVQGEVHVLSDLQRTAFRGADSVAAGLPLLFYHPAADPPVNRAVVAARASPQTWLVGSPGAVAVSVGGAPSTAPAGGKAAVTVTVGGKAGGRALMAPGDALAITAPAAEAGWIAGGAQLEPDELRADDRRPFAVRVVQSAHVRVDPQADLGGFLAEALRTLAGAGQLRLGGPASGAVTLGERAGASGASAVLFPPHDPVQIGAANRSLAAAGVPWRFGARVEREDTLATLPTVLRPIAGVQIHRRYRLEAQPGTGADVLARAGGDAWLVRSGRIVVVGSRFVEEETALPLSPGFVPFVGSLVNLLARGDEGIVEAAPGEAVPLPEAVTALGTAAGQARPVEGGRAVSAPADPGVYPLLAGADTLGELVVAPDPRESDLRRADASDLAALFPGARVTVAASARAYATERFRGAGRAELTGAALLAALLVLVVEGLVAAGGIRRERA